VFIIISAHFERLTMNFTREDIRKLIYYCWKRELSTSDVHKEINSTLGDGTVSIRTCSEWIKKFKEGNVESGDEQRCGRPSLDLTNDIERILNENNLATTKMIAVELDVSNETVRRNLMKMGKRYLVNKWIPHILTDASKEKRVNICQELLAKHQSSNFLQQLITGDEIWIFWENEGVAHHHRSWRGAGDVPATETRRALTTKKNLATIFWDCKGIILVDILPYGQTITALYYSALLDKLKVAVQQKRRRNTANGFLHLLHDNARPHTALITVNKLNEMGLNIVPHPPYSPDLAPSDYYLFSSLKSSLRGKDLSGVADIHAAIQQWMDSRPPQFFARGIKMLPKRWKLCIDNHGNYFEHLRDTDDQ
jgi:histone-lysine N-methyltransferase SETMAR